MQTRQSVGFSNAALLVVGLPVSPLAVPTAVQHEATPGTSQELGSNSASFRLGTITADPAIRVAALSFFPAIVLDILTVSVVKPSSLHTQSRVSWIRG